jgi:hypothetical protein
VSLKPSPGAFALKVGTEVLCLLDSDRGSESYSNPESAAPGVNQTRR